MDHAKAFAPGYVSGFSAIFDEDPNYSERGSVGAGFCLARGVTTRISYASGDKDLVMVNGDLEDTGGFVSQKVVARFYSRIGKVGVKSLILNHETDLPPGSTLGTCSAIALSTAMAINELHNSPLNFTEVGQVAHQGSVNCRPFFGSAAAQIAGGFTVNHAPGAPGVGRIGSFPYDKTQKVMIYEFKPMEKNPFKSPLLAGQKTVNEVGIRCKDSFCARTTVYNFQVMNRKFVKEAGLASKRVESFIEVFEKKGVPAYAIPGSEALFFLILPELEDELRKALAPLLSAGSVFISDLDTQGARLIMEE